MWFDRHFDDDEKTPSSAPDLFAEEELVPERPMQRRRSFALHASAVERTDPRRERGHSKSLCDDVAGIYAVLDGVSSEGFEHVSCMHAARVLLYWLKNTREREGLIPSGSGDPRREARRLEMALSRTHAELKSLGRKITPGSGATIGCSAVAAVPAAAHLVVAWLGDARLYRSRAGVVTQLTVDHTFSTIRQLIGGQDDTAVRRSRLNTVPSSHLGANGAVEPEINAVELEDGDHYLLCNAALACALNDEQMRARLGEAATPASVAEKLLEAASYIVPAGDFSAIVLQAEAR